MLRNLNIRDMDHYGMTLGESIPNAVGIKKLHVRQKQTEQMLLSSFLKGSTRFPAHPLVPPTTIYIFSQKFYYEKTDYEEVSTYSKPGVMLS